METKTIAHGDFGIIDHYVICNWSKKADTIVRQLHDESVTKKRPIIVITENPEKVPQSTDPAYRGLLIINGDPANKEILERADIKNAYSVIILANEEDKEKSDSKAVLIALAIGNISRDVHVIVEINESKNIKYFQYTFVNEIVCLDHLSEKLLAQAALTPSISQVYMDLLTQSADTNEIYMEPVPEKFIGKTYNELREAIATFTKRDFILIGFSTKKERKFNGTVIERASILNPSNSKDAEYSIWYKFKPKDKIIVIAYSKPHLEELLK